MLSKLKIGARLVVVISVIMVVVIAVMTIVVAAQIRNLSQDNAAIIAEETGEHYANVIKAELEVAMDEARALGSVFESMANVEGINLSRRKVNMMLKYFIENNTNFLGVYVAFEPDAFDGKDVNFINEYGHDETGRFIPYWVRGEEGTGVVEPLMDYEVEGIGDYYILPRKRNRETVLNPYLYPIQGVDVLLTSLVVPIQDEAGEFIGICGLDLTLDSLQDMVVDITLGEFDGAYVEFFSENGTIVATPRAEQVGKSLANLDYDPELVDAVQSKTLDTLKVKDAYTDADMVSTVVPVEIGYSGQSWLVVVNIPETELYAAMRSSIRTMLFIGVAMLVFSVVLVYLLSRSISIPITLITQGAGLLSTGDIELNTLNHDKIDAINKRGDELGDIGRAFSKLIEYQAEKIGMAESIAGGDLSVDVRISSKEDKLGKALALMVDSLNDLLGEVKDSVGQVHSGSDQVAQASQTLSQGATEQASSLEEVSASLTQVNSQSKHNTESAVEANGLAEKASSDAEAGNRQMKELMEAMARIDSSADEIAKISKVIDDIAFQTNLLALNANVEAARAGKYGKGFAVVAEEVRTLAVRSAEAVKETTGMVDESIRNIRGGTEIAQGTATQLEAIVEGVEKVAKLLDEITHASKEQSQAIEQVTEGLDQIEQVTQSNTASAEESASASEELSGQAEHLASMIDRFILKNDKSAEDKLRLSDMRAPEA